jgi:Cyanate permease
MSSRPAPSLHRHIPWLALAAIVLTAVNLRTAVTSITPLLAGLGAQFGFGATMTGVFGMLPTAAFALFGVLTPRVIARLGAERTALLAMAVAASGLLLRASADSTALLLLGSVVALAGMGSGNVVIPPLVKRYFPERIGAVSALYLTALQLGTMTPAWPQSHWPARLAGGFHWASGRCWRWRRSCRCGCCSGRAAAMRCSSHQRRRQQ